MATFPNPLETTSNLMTGAAVPHLSPEFPQGDPQLQIVFGQVPRDLRFFLMDTLERRAARAFQEVPSSSLMVYGMIKREPDTVSRESAEMRWLVENRPVLENYQGQWLLISGDKLVTHSADFGDLRRVIGTQNIESPFVYYVPTKQEADFVAF